MVRRVLALVLISMAFGSCAALAASESLINKSGGTAIGVVVTFSEKVRITSYDTAVFPNQDPAGRSDSFTFSGGALANLGRFKLSWTPSSGAIEGTAWQRAAASWTGAGTPQLTASDVPPQPDWATVNYALLFNEPRPQLAKLFRGSEQLPISEGTHWGLPGSDVKGVKLSYSGGGLFIRLETRSTPVRGSYLYRITFWAPEGVVRPLTVALDPVNGSAWADMQVQSTWRNLPNAVQLLEVGDTYLVAYLPSMYLPSGEMLEQTRGWVVLLLPTYVLPDGVWEAYEALPLARDVAGPPSLPTPVPVAIPGLEYLGNPFAERLPDGSGWEASRRVWDMQTFGDRIYLAHGNQRGNSGPTPVWYWDCATEVFVHDFTVDDEQITAFAVFGEEMLVAGADSTESWDFGNVYIFDGTTWTKRGTVPRALHCTSVWRFGDDLFVVSSTGETTAEILRSADNGLTWTLVFADSEMTIKPKFFEFGDHLYLSSAWGNVVLRWDGQTFAKLEGLQVFVEWVASFDPTAGFVVMHSEKLGDALVYMGVLTLWHTSVYVLREMTTTGIEKLSIGGPFQVGVGGDQSLTHQVLGEAPEDIVVEDGACWVLTNELHADDIAATVRVYTSTDLVTWAKVVEFESPAVAASFEVHGGYIYFGLGCANPYTFTETTIGVNSPTAGRIYRCVLP